MTAGGGGSRGWAGALPCRLVLVLAGALLLALGLAAPARAGDYVVSACQDPAGSPAAVDGWSPVVVGAASATSNQCPAGRAFGGSMDPSSSHLRGDGAAWTFTAPPGTEISGYTIWRSVQLVTFRSDEHNFEYMYRLVESPGDASTIVESCEALWGCTSRGTSSQPLDRANAVRRQGLSGVRQVAAGVTCNAWQACSPPYLVPAADLQLHRTDVTLLDTSDPVITSAPTGTLIDSSTTLSGSQAVSLAATDRGGGVYRVSIEIDGQVMESVTLDSNDGRCREPFTTVVPCRPSVSGTVTFDTARLPDGAHNLRILVTDATGTNQAAFGPVPIRTANHAGATGDACQAPPPPASGDLRLRASFPRGRGRATIGFGRRARVSGSLADRSAAPVAGAEICVLTRDETSRARWVPRERVRTDGRGRFRLDVRGGPSRLVRLTYLGPGGVAAATVRLRVRAAVSLRASRRRVRGGERVSLRGRLGARPAPRLLVEMQAKRGRRWQTFGTTRAGRDGRFGLRYRFTHTPGLRVFQLRARVRRQPNYPYTTGASRAVTVRVYG